MNNQESTSFIPQRPLKGKSKTRGVRKLYILSYVSYVVFFGALLSAGGAYFYQFTLENQLEAQKRALAEERQKFSEGELESVRELQKRIEAAQTRINNHVSLLAIFEALERSAVQSIQFESFSYQRNNDEFPLVTFTGSADQFNSVLYQREMFRNEPVLADAQFVELQVEELVDASEVRNDRPIVTFALEKTIDTSLIQYTPRLQIQQDSAPQPGTPQDGQINQQQVSQDGQTDQQQSDPSVEQGQENTANQNEGSAQDTVQTDNGGDSESITQ